MSSTAFSQTGIDSTSIVLPEQVAQEIAKELIQKDALEQEVQILYSKIDVLEESILTRDSLLVNRNLKISSLESINTSYRKQSAYYQKLSKELQGDLKKESFRKKVYKSSSGILTVAGAILIIFSK